MRRVADEYPDRVMIGEAYLPIDRLMAYYGVDLSGFHLPFNFHLIATPWHPTALAALIEAYEAALPAGGWPNWVLGNHDRSRVATRIGPAQARVAAMLLLTLRGTPTIYQGEEIGMSDVPIPPERVQDPWERNVPGWPRPRPGPHANAVGRQPECRLHQRRALAAARRRTMRLSMWRRSGRARSMLSLYRRCSRCAGASRRC